MAAAEGPASVLLTGMFNTCVPKRGPEYEVSDCHHLMDDPLRYYTQPLREFTMRKVERISCPLMIVRGDQHLINRINELILIPALREARKSFLEKSYAGQRHCFGLGTKIDPKDAFQWEKFFADLLEFLKHRDGAVR